ncbi:hypothetical protein DYB26_012501, partial [Aphanomyces astaci]
KQHLVQLPGLGVDVILGCNGYLWITRSMDDVVATDGAQNELTADAWTERKVSHANTVTDAVDRHQIARVYNALASLNARFRLISPESILETIQALERGDNLDA